MDLKASSVLATSAEPSYQATKKHLRGSALLLVGRVIAMATNFAVQVLIVRYLSKSDFGAFAYVMSVVALGASFAVFGMDKTVTRFLPIYQEKGEHPELFGSLILIIGTILSISFFLVVSVFGLQGWLAQSYIKDQQIVRLLLLVIFLVPISAFDSLLLGMLAIFSEPSTIFFRRHILGPGLKLLVVLLLILFGLNVYFLSMGFVISGAFGVLLYAGILLRDLRSQEFWKHFKRQDIRFPIKEVYSFSAPLLTRNLLYVMRGQLIVVLLEYFHKARDVADFRAVQPVADLNTVVLQSFSLLFMPAMARLFAKNDQEGINNLYWQSTIWVTVITFPIFLVTFSLAQPVTLLLFGARYADSGLIMALLAFGYYFNAALGYNADTLQVYGKLRYMVTVDFTTMLICLALSLLLIPKYAATGAAVAACGTLVLYNILNHLGLKFAAHSDLFRPRYLKVYVSILLGSMGLLLFEYLVSIPLIISLILAGLISLVVLLVNRDLLEIEQTFPELLKFQVVRFLFKSKPRKT